MKRYSLIYSDPAWSYGNKISNGAAVDHYPTMSLLDMKRLPRLTRKQRKRFLKSLS